MSLTQQLHEAIAGSGVTLYRVAKDTGIPYAVVHRFARGERSINLETADKLADFFGMHLTRPKRIAPRRK